MNTVKDLLLVVWVALVAPDPLLERDRASVSGRVLIDPWASFEVTVDGLIDPWRVIRPAELSLGSLTFPKVDADELKAFAEPRAPSFDKVDSNELKLFPFES